MASAAAIQKREAAVLGKIQLELSFFVDRQAMSVTSTGNLNVPKEFNLDNFQICDGNIDFTPECHLEKTQNIENLASPPASDDKDSFTESLEWFGRLLETASNAACSA